MKKNSTRIAGFIAISTIVLFAISCKKEGPRLCHCNPNNIVISQSVFSSGLNNPRGLKFGPDGNLYVAEGGVGGKDSTIGICDQVPDAGPYLGSDTGARISRIDRWGTRTTVADKIPSSSTAQNIGGFVSGVADVAFIDNKLYGLLTGAGCSHGVPGIPNGVFKVNRDKTWTLINDLSAFYKSHPVKNPNPGDFEPDGTPYSMISLGDRLFSIEPNHGELDEMNLKGKIRRIIDISAFEGHIVPTAVTFHDGNFYVGNLNTFPASGKSSIYKITPDGQISTFVTGFNMVLGVLFDELGGLYILESTTGNPFPTPGTGDVIRIDRDGSRMTIASGLNLPTAMTFGPDEKLYISNWGFGGAPGMGEIVQVDITCAKANHFKKGNSD
jgi:hypothetical protein